MSTPNTPNTPIAKTGEVWINEIYEVVTIIDVETSNIYPISAEIEGKSISYTPNGCVWINECSYEPHQLGTDLMMRITPETNPEYFL